MVCACVKASICKSTGVIIKDVNLLLLPSRPLSLLPPAPHPSLLHTHTHLSLYIPLPLFYSYIDAMRLWAVDLNPHLARTAATFVFFDFLMGGARSLETGEYLVDPDPDRAVRERERKTSEFSTMGSTSSEVVVAGGGDGSMDGVGVDAAARRGRRRRRRRRGEDGSGGGSDDGGGGSGGSSAGQRRAGAARATQRWEEQRRRGAVEAELAEKARHARQTMTEEERKSRREDEKLDQISALLGTLQEQAKSIGSEAKHQEQLLDFVKRDLRNWGGALRLGLAASFFPEVAIGGPGDFRGQRDLFGLQRFEFGPLV